MVSAIKKYIPSSLNKKDKTKQKKEIEKSKKMYKKGRFHTREKVKSFSSKKSGHILKASNMYSVDKIRPSKKLSKKTGCNIKGLKEIIKKGQGAYFSSGSRPNQTPSSWAYARLASSITGGNSSIVDYHILKEHCSKNSKALKLARKRVKQKGGELPKLKKVSKENKKHIYKLKDPAKKRRLAIDEGVTKEGKKVGKKKAASMKKGRFNILRIYRRNNDKEGCKRITADMKYMDKKYKLGSTKNICEDIVDCCKSDIKSKKCKRKKDGKVFKLPRRFSKKKCIKGPINGFSMKSSCSPFIGCK